MAEAQIADESVDVSANGLVETILGELRTLRDQVPADPETCVAILDGPVDLNHPCFRGASVRRVNTLVGDEPGPGPMSAHGTHVASVVFGQPLSGTLGLAPGCRGLVAPVFRDNSGYLSQLDLARAIEVSVSGGATIINISGGERVAGGDPDPLLARAIDLCEQSGVLVVAATGNDGCDCLHVPAALSTVIAVGALGRNGIPLPTSNFGGSYSSHGVLAPGEKVPGAVPGGAITTYTGSSFAAPMVSALAALLMCEQRRLTGTVDVPAVREAILASASPCPSTGSDELSRCLRGILNVRGAYELITRGGEVSEVNGIFVTHVAAPGGAVPSSPTGVVAAGATQLGDLPPMDAGPPPPAPVDPAAFASGGAVSASSVAAPAAVMPSAEAHVQAPHESAPTSPLAPAAVVPSGGSCSCGTRPSGDAPSPIESSRATAVSRVFAIGTVGFDFGTEARRDTFRQLMPVTESAGTPPVQREPNPYDATQLADYLDSNPWDSTKVTWTMNLDLTPVYAIEAESTYASYVYEMLRAVLRNQVLPESDENFVSRVSFPGVLTDRTIRLFSGQVVPVMLVQRRGLSAWNERTLVSAVVDAIDLPGVLDSIGVTDEAAARNRLEQKVRQMLDKVYYELRNLGTSPQDRAINYMATNAFNYTSTIAQGLLSGEIADSDTTTLYSLESIGAVKSPYCRIDSDCWDVRFTFFAPDNDRRARVVYQTTVDVSDELPVTLSPMRQYLVGGS